MDQKEIDWIAELKSTNNIIDFDMGRIYGPLQNLILYFGEPELPIDMKQGEIIMSYIIGQLHPREITYGKLICPLIWNALKIHRYPVINIPEKWLVFPKFENEDDKAHTFNMVSKLSEISGWASYALTCLIDYDINSNVLGPNDNHGQSLNIRKTSKYMTDYAIVNDNLLSQV